MKVSPRIIVWTILSIVAIGLVLLRWYTSTIPRMPQLITVSEIPEFTLLTQDSLPFSKKDLDGKITIADFIFTSCGGPCPLMSSKMMELQEQFKNFPEVRLLSFSVDPEYDTPSVLLEYGQKFGAKKERWTFLTGDKKTLYTLAIKGFHLGVEEDSTAILHSTKFVLVDSRAMIRGYYDYDDPNSIHKLTSDINILLTE